MSGLISAQACFFLEHDQACARLHFRISRSFMAVARPTIPAPTSDIAVLRCTVAMPLTDGMETGLYSGFPMVRSNFSCP